MRKSFWTSLLLILLALALMVLAAGRIGPITNLRRQYDIEPINPFADAEVTSDLRIPTVAFFTFRSIAIDYLWIRADNLKQEGQYFDALHLARMICALQPNLPSVWIFQAWNMAYNISVALPNAAERWNWVQAGYKLLRDEAIPANPRSPLLYRELGWFLEHKIGGISDDRHRFYKLAFAYEMMPILGSGTHEEIQALADAERDWPTLKAEPAIATLIEQIKEAQVEFADDEQMFVGWLDFKVSPNRYSPQLHQVIANNIRTEPFRKLDLFIRARTLRREWKMDPAKMVELNQKYGPVDYENEGKRLSLDWRLSYCHAIYWCEQGLPHADVKGKKHLALQRIIYHSLQDLFHYGYLQIFPGPPPVLSSKRQEGQEVLESEQQAQMRIFLSQDLRMFPIAYQATLDVIDSYIKHKGKDPGGVVAGSVNLCRAGIVSLYLAGHSNYSHIYYNDLRQRYPDKKDYQKSLEEFIANHLKEEIAEISPKNASDYVDSMLRRSYAYYAVGNDDMSTFFKKYAEQVYRYNKQQDTAVHVGRLDLPDFARMHRLALKNFMMDPQINPYRKSMLAQRMRIEAPEEFDWLKNEFEKQKKDSLPGPVNAQ